MEASKRLFDFTYLHAVFIVGAVVTYLVDLVFGKYFKNKTSLSRIIVKRNRLLLCDLFNST